MSENQKKAAAFISFAALLLAVTVAFWLAHLALDSTFITNDPNREEQILLESWTAIAWFMKSATVVKVTFGGLLTILAIGTGILGELYKKATAIIFISVLCLAGILACTTIMIEVAKEDNLETFSYYAGYDAEEALRSDVNTSFGWAITWFTSFLAAQLGISSIARNGVVKRLWSRWRGADAP
jgi:hypothetical protein